MIEKHKILLSGNKKIKKDRNTVLFFSKQEMKIRLQEDPNIRILGGTRLKKVTDRNEYKADFFVTMPSSDEILYLGKRKQKGLIKGYFQIDENEFLEYRSFFIVFILFLGILLATVFILIFADQNLNRTKYERPIIQEAEKWNGVITQNGKIQEFEDERIDIPGYHELYVSIEEPFVLLGNPKENTVLFKYEVVEGDTVIFASDYIEPGNKVEWNAYDVLSSKDHSLIFVISTLDAEEYFPCNGASLSVELHVK